MASEVPPTMKAWTSCKRGPHRQILSLNIVPTPKLSQGTQLLIKIAYSGLNPGDTKIMRMIPNIIRDKYCIPAMDFSGIVVSVGPLVDSTIRPGMRVFGMLNTEYLMKGRGTLAEYIIADTKKHVIAPVPDNLSLEEAGCVGIAVNMAYLECKLARMKEGCGWRVLINGASGGCGSMFVQAAKAMGAKEIVATCSAPNFDLVKSLGADKVIDYREKKPLHTHLTKEFGNRPFDFILDTVGVQDLYTNSPKYLKKGGAFMNIGDYTEGTFRTLWNWFLNAWWPTWLGGTPRKYIMFSGNVDLDGTEWMAKMTGEGKLKAVIDRTMAFEDVLEAFDIVDSRRVRGRIVVKVAE